MAGGLRSIKSHDTGEGSVDRLAGVFKARKRLGWVMGGWWRQWGWKYSFQNVVQGE